jgi:hypothetical protein
MMEDLAVDRGVFGSIGVLTNAGFFASGLTVRTNEMMRMPNTKKHKP